MEKHKEHEQALQQVKALAAPADYAGVPANIVYGIVGLSVGMGATLRSLLIGIVFLFALGIPMYQIHRGDIDGLKVWIKAIKRRTEQWCGGRSRKRELIIIKEKDN